jgi:PleD family two-component response regulator
MSIAGSVDASEVTLSAGVATVPDDADDANGLVSAADDALYVAKRAGRDRAARPER